MVPFENVLMNPSRQGAVRYYTLYVLNLFDCAMTMWFVSNYGLNIEGNPIGVILLQNPIVAMLVKAIVIGVAVFILYKNRGYHFTQIAVNFVLAIYSVLAIYHIILLSIVISIVV